MQDENSIRHKDIKGWGIDADPLDLPAYPMKIRSENDNRKGLFWERPLQQAAQVEILVSNERPTITSVFGTPNPPSGLSGKIRRYAFKFSESSYGHWLSLLLADRVNVIEGIVDDIKQGSFPNLFAELGGRAELKHNPARLAKKVAIGLAITAGIVLLCKRNSRDRSS
ncbi:hypothetical protein ACFP1I_28370 [Dyadobacter subterraneus]|uniref:Uncharacterized protein n=1 Tax=Dyadobacter subterraneus TaxID=2773304 RepID=A0ABR9WCT0_9BACT|nr:hypothetical protein [Dyadobacter subterraneus]MBE9463283.1 hypothetical protein [Dyadobacter subterraneus]